MAKGKTSSSFCREQGLELACRVCDDLLSSMAIYITLLSRVLTVAGHAYRVDSQQASKYISFIDRSSLFQEASCSHECLPGNSHIILCQCTTLNFYVQIEILVMYVNTSSETSLLVIYTFSCL